MIVVSHEDDYFERTPIEKQRVCCNCWCDDALQNLFEEDFYCAFGERRE